MTTDQTEVIFFREEKTEQGAIVHKLADLHVRTIDTADKKVHCNRHFSVTLMTTKGHRRLYFLTHAHMLDGIEYLLRAQGFETRISQYKYKKDLPDNEVNYRWLAKHQSTKEVVEVK